jgi:hypothetical protein
MFKDIFPWVISFVKMGDTKVQVRSLKEDGSAFKLANGSFSEFSIVKVK